MKRFSEPLIFLGLLLVALGVLRGASLSQEFTIDESRWIATSRYFWTTFVERDLFGPSWQPNYLVLTQPPVARYVFGFGLWLQGWGPEQLNGRYDSLRTRDFNERAGNIPSPELLAAARRVSLVLALAAVSLLYLVGRMLGGPPAGLAAAGLALASPLLSTLWTRALAEACLATMTLLALYFGLRVARGVRGATEEIGLGTALGLAAGTKLSGGIGAVALACFGLVDGAHSMLRERRLGSIPTMVGAASAAVVVFVLVNPLLYPAPVSRALLMLEHRRTEMQEQRQRWPAQAISDNLVARAEHVVQQVFVRYRALPGLGDAGLAVAGAGLAVASIRRGSGGGASRWPLGLLLLWTAATYAIVTVNLGFDSSHYYAPLVTLDVLLEGYAVSLAAQWAARAIQNTHFPAMKSGSRTAQTARNIPSPTQTSGPVTT